MFVDARSFNGDLSAWDVSKVTDMGAMFSGARVFNGDLNSWHTSSSTKWTSMFAGAWHFNSRPEQLGRVAVTVMRGVFKRRTRSMAT